MIQLLLLFEPLMVEYLIKVPVYNLMLEVIVSCFRTCDVTTRLNDIIKVYDGDTAGSPVIGQYCGHKTAQEVLSTGKRLMVKFLSNQEYNMQGFSAVFKFIKQKKG